MAETKQAAKNVDTYDDKAPKNTKDTTKDDVKTEDKDKETFGDKLKGFMSSAKKGVEELGKKMSSRVTMEGLLKQARISVEDFFNPELKAEKQIPVMLLKKCEGIVLITQVKASIAVGGSAGTGIVMRRTKDGWSLPCAVGMGGFQWGFNIGAQKADHVIILRNEEAIKAFSSKGNVKFGGDASISLGPKGRNAQIAAAANEKGYAAMVSYSRSKGAYIGVALEGTGLANRPDCNQEFYDPDEKNKGKIKYNADAIWSGKFKMPENEDYKKIVVLLEKYQKQAAAEVAKKKAEKMKKNEKNEEEKDKDADDDKDDGKDKDTDKDQTK